MGVDARQTADPTAPRLDLWPPPSMWQEVSPGAERRNRRSAPSADGDGGVFISLQSLDLLKSALISPERVKKRKEKEPQDTVDIFRFSDGFATVVTEMFVATGQMIYWTLQTTLDMMKELHIKKALDEWPSRHHTCIGGVLSS